MFNNHLSCYLDYVRILIEPMILDYTKQISPYTKMFDPDDAYDLVFLVLSYILFYFFSYIN